MKDLRCFNIHMGGITKINGLAVNEDTVKQMFVTLGIKPEEILIREAIGYLSSNGMEFTMSNLYDFLQSKSIVSIVDLRKKKL